MATPSDRRAPTRVTTSQFAIGHILAESKSRGTEIKLCPNKAGSSKSQIKLFPKLGALSLACG